MSLSEKLIVAAKKGNAREVRKLLGRGALFTKDQYGNTALHEAAWNGNKDIVKSLLGAFCFVDSINHTGFTALHLASQNGHSKVVKTLLKWRADPGLLNQHGETALHLVAKYNHPAVISAFCALKIYMDIRGKDGNTALHISAKLGNSEVLKSLLQNGADPSLLNMTGQSALELAEAGKYKESTKFIQSALSKWKPRMVSGVSPNNYGLIPARIKRAETYGSQSSATKTASKIRLMKTKTGAKSYSFSKDKRHKSSGYFSEDESYRSQVASQSRFSSAQEVPNSFSYGASVGSEHGFLMGPRSVSPAAQSKSASIDQLLTEMEREYLGPGYSFSPPEDKSKGLITPYAEIRQLEPPRPISQHATPPKVGSSTQRPTLRTLHVFSQENRINYDFLKPTAPQETYDSLHSSASNASSHTHFHLRKNGRMKNKTISSRLSKSPSSSPHHSPSKTAHKTFPTREEVIKAGVMEDTDTYVYMAPVSDYPDSAMTAGHVMAGRELLDVELELESDGEGSVHLREAAAGSEVSSVNGSENGSRNSKRAIICNSPLEADRRHEPNSALEPVKGILSQSSASESDKSHLEKYLQDELETMRQAFQIRLGQLEKRYRRQLIFEQQRSQCQPETSRHSSSSSSQEVARRMRNINMQTNASERRNSWHSYITSEQELDKLAEPDEPRSSSSLGVDSDHSVDGSDVETWEVEEEEERDVGTKLKSVRIAASLNTVKSKELSVNELPESTRDDPEGDHAYSVPRSIRAPPPPMAIYSTPTKAKVGLKGGAKSWKEERAQTSLDSPKLSPVSNELSQEEATSIDDDAKTLIQKKIEEYREKMMQYFQEKSEAQISVIEEKYQKQMAEVRRKSNEEASEKMSHLATRIKDLESMLDVQTLV